MMEVPVVAVQATPRAPTLAAEMVVSVALYPEWTGSLWNWLQSPVAAATGAASGPAQTAKSPESRSATRAMLRSRTKDRREAGEPP